MQVSAREMDGIPVVASATHCGPRQIQCDDRTTRDLRTANDTHFRHESRKIEQRQAERGGDTICTYIGIFYVHAAVVAAAPRHTVSRECDVAKHGDMATPRPLKANMIRPVTRTACSPGCAGLPPEP